MNQDWIFDLNWIDDCHFYASLQIENWQKKYFENTDITDHVELKF